MYTHTNFTAALLGFSPRVVPTHRSIKARADAIWRNRQRPFGEDLAIWLEAESLLAAGRRPVRNIRERLRDGYAPRQGGHRSPTSL